MCTQPGGWDVTVAGVSVRETLWHVADLSNHSPERESADWADLADD